MQIEQALEYIWNRPKMSRNIGLHRMKSLMARFDNPHFGLKIIHVAGTNGKGSVCTYLESMLRKAGYRTGLYTSPHIERVEERIRVESEMISEDELARLATLVEEQEGYIVEETGEGLSEFEVLTAIAFLYFASQNCDFVILEVGLGGRFDATNICIPIVSVITSISSDHEDILGDTVEKIAFEKCGIIKKEIPVVVGPQRTGNIETVIFDETFRNRSTAYLVTVDAIDITSLDFNHLKMDFTSPFRKKYYDIESEMFGLYQAENIATAISVMDCLEEKRHLRINQSDILEGIKTAKIGARMEILQENPLSIVDGAHNAVGLELLYDALFYFKESAKIKGFVFVSAMMRDKRIEEQIDRLVELSDYTVFTHLNYDRSLEKAELQQIYHHRENEAEFVETTEEAVQKAISLAQEKDLCIIYSGSLYLAGEVKEVYRKITVDK